MILTYRCPLETRRLGATEFYGIFFREAGIILTNLTHLSTLL